MNKMTIDDAKKIRELMDEYIHENEKPVKKLNHFTDVKTFEDAISFSGEKTEEIIPFYLTANTERKKWLNRIAELELIAHVLRNGWQPNWDDSNEKKWYCWFKWDSKNSAFVFVGTDYGWTATDADVGSRLCFPSSEMAEYFGKQFIEQHNEFLKNK